MRFLAAVFLLAIERIECDRQRYAWSARGVRGLLEETRIGLHGKNREVGEYCIRVVHNRRWPPLVPYMTLQSASSTLYNPTNSSALRRSTSTFNDPRSIACI